MDFENISPDAFGASLRGFGVNLLVRNVRKTVLFLDAVFGIASTRVSDDFAIVRYGSQILMLHADPTYANHPAFHILPENPPRGAGITLHLYDTDPDLAAAACEHAGGAVMAAPQNKPHGLREAVIADDDGYLWCPSRPLSPDEFL